MADLFPDLAERLTALLYRIIDLLQIVRDHVAHPDFHGSYSMKAVAPALAREVTYDDLDIADGLDRQATTENRLLVGAGCSKLRPYHLQMGT